MGFVVGIALMAIGLLLLNQSWRSSQDQFRPTQRTLATAVLRADLRTVPQTWYRVQRSAAVPLGVTAGCTALGGLAVVASGWDSIGRLAAAATLVILVAGIVFTWWTASRAARVRDESRVS